MRDEFSGNGTGQTHHANGTAAVNGRPRAAIVGTSDREPSRGGNAAGGDEEEASVEGNPDRPRITIAGKHHVRTAAGNRRIVRGNDTFVDLVLSKLPPDLLYRSGNTIGLLTPDTETGELAYDPIVTADIDYLVDRYVMLRTWTRNAAGRPIPKFVNCSRKQSSVIESRAKRHPSVRLLTRIVQYPLYGPGMVRYPAGWSRDGTYFDCPKGLADLSPEMDESVIRDQLLDLITDFPFRDETDRHNFIGMLLTPLVRPALDGNVPLHMVIAPMARTGKSKLIEEVWGGVILGHPTPAQPMTGDDVEFEKKVVSMLIAGDTLIHLDNLPGSIDSAVLASLLTASDFQGRELGRSKVLRLRNTLILAASGNNTRATEELAKRTVPIRLQTVDEHPENRVGFAHPELRGHVREVRRGVLECLLGMVERWKAAGCPAGRRPMGGFEAWARVVGGIMHANGFDGWLTNADEWRKQSDPETDDLRALVTEWARLHNNRPITASAVMEVATSFGLFTGVLDKKTEAGRRTAFSRGVLNKHEGRPFAGLRITKDVSGNNAAYRLEGDDGAFEMVHRTPTRERLTGHGEPTGVPPDFD